MYTMNVDIRHGDCIEEMMTIRAGSVDAVICDPPYNIARENNFQTMGRSGIDFGDWDKDFDLFSYIDELPRILKKGGNLFIFNDWKNLGDIARYAESKGFVIKDIVRWEKTNPMPRNRDRRFITDCEFGVWLVHGKGKWVFNRQSEKYDRPLFRHGIVSGKEKTIHTTQKPVALMEEIISTLTNEGDTILDPFMGSGSTGVACVSTGRKFIGVEKDIVYFNISKSRMSKGGTCTL